MHKIVLSCMLLLHFTVSHSQLNQKVTKLTGIPFSAVTVNDNFWKPKIDKVATSTLDACIYQTETATPRLRNFEKIAMKNGAQHEGLFYDDSDVFKALEAMAYSLKTHPSDSMEAKCDKWIDIIAAAQLPDGYLNTWYTLKGLDERWTDMSMHEDYNAGHMIEAAVAYYNVTAKRKFLDVCIKWVDHFSSRFGPGKMHWVTGHEELELALVKLYRVTNNKDYLNLAHWLLSERGHGFAKGYTWTDWKDTAYAQDVLPVKDQTEITGHAVRAMYLYTGAADVSAQMGDSGYMKAMKAVWDDVVHRNMYITGGIGSAGSNEGFSKDYDLPNEYAYCETCASVGMVFWNERMNWLTGEAKYMDVLERSLYNAALDGLSLSGDRFFYGNPLASRGQHARREWFGTACCPANIARLVASVGDYIYAKADDAVYINLFVGSETAVSLKNTSIKIKQQTGYPWNGNVVLNIDPVKKQRFQLAIRVPGWLRGDAVPGDLYRFTDSTANGQGFELLLNGKSIEYVLENGYAMIMRQWQNGDVITVNMDMPVRRLMAREEVTQDTLRMALQRGPIVYCVEGADNGDKAWNILFPSNSNFITTQDSVLSEPIVSIRAMVPELVVNSEGTLVETKERMIRAIPYYTWANRGKNEMQVWLPVRISNIKINY